MSPFRRGLTYAHACVCQLFLSWFLTSFCTCNICTALIRSWKFIINSRAGDKYGQMIKWHREKRCWSESTKWHPTQVSEFNIQKILPVKHWCSSTCGMTTLRLWDFHRTSWSTCWYTLSIKAIQHQKPYSKTHSPGESNTPKSQVGWEMPATDCMIILLNNWIVLTMKTSKWIKLYIFKLPLRFTIHHHHNSASRKFSCCSGVFNKMASAICSRSRLERRKSKKSTGWQGWRKPNNSTSNVAI